MLATDHIQLAKQFLVDADRELEDGDVFQASEKLWGAASHVVIAEMHRREIKQSGHRAMVRSVGHFGEDFNDPVLRPLFSSAEILHANFYHGFLENEDVKEHRDSVNVFVNRMVELIDRRNGAEN
ncbi:MAG: hypothetical protein F4Y63_04295 [Chloroflexi bacterium]|nr:hypothetical protein [Chloroflexota bacterium]MYF79831.1 hypothetical protein [Chloroflexota bacterium]MYK60512.1 hypothetical protein [Chloroflexota bacterium]